jgi:hypothetical protein
MIMKGRVAFNKFVLLYVNRLPPPKAEGQITVAINDSRSKVVMNIMIIVLAMIRRINSDFLIRRDGNLVLI